VTIPPFLSEPPKSDGVTDYDLAHKITYLRLLDAHAEGADWREIARIVLDLDVGDDEKQARKIYDSHLARARWMTEAGYRDLLQQRDN
jgi:predicted SprT family Zn-dependent metalloprotease